MVPSTKQYCIIRQTGKPLPRNNTKSSKTLRSKHYANSSRLIEHIRGLLHIRGLFFDHCWTNWWPIASKDIDPPKHGLHSFRAYRCRTRCIIWRHQSSELKLRRSAVNDWLDGHEFSIREKYDYSFIRCYLSPQQDIDIVHTRLYAKQKVVFIYR